MPTEFPENTDQRQSETNHRKSYTETLDRLATASALHFSKIIRSYVYFNCSAIAAIFLEILAFFIFLAFFSTSIGVTLALSLIFLTVFSHNIIKLYLQNKKIEHFDSLLHGFLEGCRQALELQDGILEHIIILANASIHLSEKLEGQAPHYYRLPSRLLFLRNSAENFSTYWHWNDINIMREKILSFAGQKYIEIIREEPTNLELHAALANIYVTSSTIYQNQPPLSVMENKQAQKIRTANFSKTSQKAIEEFKILCEYAPDDPWVHAQLAYSYHDLQMPKKEMAELEIILRLVPDDIDTMFQLGSLYFRQGLNARGLQVYESIKKLDYERANKLIHYYGNIN